MHCARLRTRVAAALLTAAATALTTAGTALAAGTVTADTSGVDYVGDAGANVVTVTDAVQGTGLRITFSETGITAGAGCMQQVNSAYCDTDDESDSVDIRLGGGADKATLNLTRATTFLSGEGGNDELTGGNEAVRNFRFESMDGGPGTDRLISRAGDSELFGGPGNGDVSEGGAGQDLISYNDEIEAGDIAHGGPGLDIVSVSWFGPDPVPGAVVDLAAGTAQFPGKPPLRFDGFEDARGDDGPDRLLGSPLPNMLRGDDGADVIDGRQGPDRELGDASNDRLEGADGFADFMTGGAGSDTCNADQLDTRELCEAGALVALPPFGSMFGDRRAARCTAQRVPSKPKVKGVRKRGLAFRATCDEAARLGARLLAGLKRVGRAPKLSRVGDVELGSRSVRVSAGKQVSLRLGVAKRFRRLLRRRLRLRIELASTDAAGNERVTSRRVRLR